MQLVSGRTLNWNLPAGVYSLLAKVDDQRCTTRSYGPVDESVCQLSGNSQLTIRDYADVTLQISPEGGLLVSFSTKDRCKSGPRGPGEGCDIQATISTRDKDIEVESYEFIQYEATPGHDTLRLPIVGRTAVLGSDLRSASGTEDTPYDHWQPILTNGDVRIIATNIPGDERYTVLEESLDSGDVVQIGEPTEPTSIWGMVDISQPSPGAGRSDGYRLNTVLHASVPEVRVTRFGSPAGHLINVSKWTVLSRWPNGQQGWVVVVSVSVLVTFVLQLGSTFRAIRDEQSETDTQEPQATVTAGVEAELPKATPDNEGQTS